MLGDNGRGKGRVGGEGGFGLGKEGGRGGPRSMNTGSGSVSKGGSERGWRGGWGRNPIKERIENRDYLLFFFEPSRSKRKDGGFRSHRERKKKRAIFYLTL